ncbi:MAG: hypothetical protein OQK05_09215 [Pseudopelagicola sp.]|nr:hypothetical protein [Pseudopelagicola sp.]
MSDPVTNVEIEDVLSSIRRLISENDRSPKPRASVSSAVSEAPHSAVETADAEAARDRLVLTPALRVAEVAPETPELDDAESQPSESQPSESVAEEALHEPHDHAWEDAGATFDAEEEAAFDEAHGAADEIAAEIEEDLSEAGFDPVDGVSLKRARELDSRIVHWDKMAEAGGSADASAYEPDEPGDSDYAGTDVEPLEWQDDLPDALEEDTKAPDRAEGFAGDFKQDPEAKTPHTDPQDRSDRPYVEETSAEEALAGLAGRIEAELHDSIPGQIEAELTPEAALDDLAGDDAMELDEAVLRDMVADIVRQELQGALGERITRNVRKLVRREIHRALAAHELE